MLGNAIKFMQIFSPLGRASLEIIGTSDRKLAQDHPSHQRRRGSCCKVHQWSWATWAKTNIGKASVKVGWYLKLWVFVCCYPARRVFILKRRAERPGGQTAINETILYHCCWGKEFHVSGVHFYSTSPWNILRMECVSPPPLHSYKACRCKRCKGMVPVSTMQPGAKMQPELLGSCCLAASNGFRASLLSILSTQRRAVVPQKLALFLFAQHFLSPDIFPSFINIALKIWFPFFLQLCSFHLSVLLVYFLLFCQAKTEIPRSFRRLGRCGLRSRKRRLKNS